MSEYDGRMTRAELHMLLDSLPDERLEEARQRLSELVEDPVLGALMLAPIDDEPLTDDERAEIDEAKPAYRRGEWISDDELARWLGE